MSSVRLPVNSGLSVSKVWGVKLHVDFRLCRVGGVSTPALFKGLLHISNNNNKISTLVTTVTTKKHTKCHTTYLGATWGETGCTYLKGSEQGRH